MAINYKNNMDNCKYIYIIYNNDIIMNYIYQVKYHYI